MGFRVQGLRAQGLRFRAPAYRAYSAREVSRSALAPNSKSSRVPVLGGPFDLVSGVSKVGYGGL